ncbi:outer membrane lipid asymmetry maintenance protein MlaD [Enterovibrio norvegicus]|uniref:Outer membrane lipid asymmetry maintenance protein MlaD n=1 Tax=Enterovibrio norvegicus TaxID=188144 RepID=A0A2N7LCI6_9GAMM|nr:outer membrane lipid asymmetry maintenance protein MlaD [Enterovibrio norvegicus]MCC4799544.1 outer membrane lipid asymmetry maintenance protein MlaD [Enterovibrio norvegicus]OEE51884.1 outer membrane lipid asymmetry maintenance protein MlaD [Enterovibrio norvegicus]OEF52759.1 outer membrane lipid asymmetry maintenance protein MlaD [Enterovibrio norvegicus]OEF57667.1 outer membrane lipid asymmetry maintenance protein MlaD [Enterovibrio norvegicus]PMH67185.1 outer membrane lipid asymmetry ma
MQQNRKTEFWVGTFVLAGIAAVLMLIFQVADVKSFSRSDYYTLEAHFDDIGGLKVRSPVKVGGVVVGRVSDISLTAPDYVPSVTLEIERKYGFFPESSSAAILTSGLLGEQFIGIRPGFLDEDIDVLQDGDLLEDTRSALVLEDLIGQFLYSVGGDKE